MRIKQLALSMLLTFLALLPQARSEDPKPQAKPYPFSVKVRGEGQPMILIPGLACSGAVWDDTVKRFEKKYQCHVLTLAGFAGEPARPGPFLEKARDGIIQYIRDKKLEKPIIVGHSLGGFLAYDLGITASDVVGPLIAVDGLPFISALFSDQATEEQVKTWAPALGKRMAEQPREEFIKQSKQQVAAWISDEAKQELVNKWGADSDQKAVADAMSSLMARDLREKAAKIKAPVLLVAAPVAFGGMSKEEATKRYKAQIEKIPNKTFAVAAKSKHFVMFDEPEWFYRQIEEFLAGTRK